MTVIAIYRRALALAGPSATRKIEGRIGECRRRLYGENLRRGDQERVARRCEAAKRYYQLARRYAAGERQRRELDALAMRCNQAPKHTQPLQPKFANLGPFLLLAKQGQRLIALGRCKEARATLIKAYQSHPREAIRRQAAVLVQQAILNCTKLHERPKPNPHSVEFHYLKQQFREAQRDRDCKRMISLSSSLLSVAPADSQAAIRKALAGCRPGERSCLGLSLGKALSFQSYIPGRMLARLRSGVMVLVSSKYVRHPGSFAEDFYLTAVTAAGRVIWERLFGGRQGDRAQVVIATRDGGMLVAGSTRSFGQNAHPGVLVAKFDAAGKRQWFRVVGPGPFSHAVRDAIQTRDGGYAVLSPHVHDSYLFRFDHAGQPLWKALLKGGFKARNVVEIVGGHLLIPARSKHIWQSGVVLHLIGHAGNLLFPPELSRLNGTPLVVRHSAGQLTLLAAGVLLRVDTRALVRAATLRQRQLSNAAIVRRQAFSLVGGLSPIQLLPLADKGVLLLAKQRFPATKSVLLRWDKSLQLRWRRVIAASSDQALINSAVPQAGGNLALAGRRLNTNRLWLLMLGRDGLPNCRKHLP